jgi:hypothetical protein
MPAPCGRLPAVSLLAELDAFYTEHRRGGNLDGGVEVLGWPTEGGRSMPGETKVEIVLTEESHQCLMDHVSESSSAFDPLQAAIHLHGYGTTPAHAVVKCDLAAATELLAVAEQHCKAAVHDIKIAIGEPQGRS